MGKLRLCRRYTPSLLQSESFATNAPEPKADDMRTTALLESTACPQTHVTIATPSAAGPQTLFGFQLVTGQSTRVGLTAGVGEDLPQDLKVRRGLRQYLHSLYCLFPSVSHAHGNAIMQSGANVHVCAVTRWALACHACTLP